MDERLKGACFEGGIRFWQTTKTAAWWEELSGVSKREREREKIQQCNTKLIVQLKYYLNIVNTVPALAKSILTIQAFSGDIDHSSSYQTAWQKVEASYVDE